MKTLAENTTPALSAVHRTVWKTAALFLAISFILNLLCNCYSPLFKLVSCMDAACFHMAGKAWAHGLVPYVDFVDVKGPLLFWLHRMGYTLAPNSTLGIFCIHILATTATLCAAHLTARIFLSSRCRAAAAAILSALFLFFPGLYICGGQAEELMLPFMAWLLYSLCRFEYAPEGRGYRSTCMLGLCLGVGAASTFLIKYNASPVFAAAAGLISLQMLASGAWRDWLYRLVPATTAGFVAVAAPFAAYMLATDSLDDFINVYFLLNFGTYFSSGSGFVGGDTLTSIVYFLENIIRANTGTWVFLSCLFFFLPPFSNGQRICKVPVTSAVLFLSAFSAYVCCSSGFSHYMLFCAPLCLIPCIWVLAHINLRVRPWHVLVLAVLACYTTVRFNANWSTNARMRVTQKLSADEKRVEDYINRVPQAKLLYLGCLDYGFGVKGGALPAAPEWFTLNGSNKEFRARQLAAIHAGKPDFVVSVDFRWGTKPAHTAENSSLYSFNFHQFLQESGYTRLSSFNEGRQRNGPSQVSLYCRNNLSAALQDESGQESVNAGNAGARPSE